MPGNVLQSCGAIVKFQARCTAQTKAEHKPLLTVCCIVMQVCWGLPGAAARVVPSMHFIALTSKYLGSLIQSSATYRSLSNLEPWYLNHKYLSTLPDYRYLGT